MSIFCAVGHHRAGSRRVRNQGFEFGRCRGCGRDLIRSRTTWRSVPAGFRVVWRREPGPRAEPNAAQLLLDLPAAGRVLAARRAPGRKKSSAAAAAELVVLGARYLASAIAGRIWAWGQSRRAPRMAPQPVLSLPAG